MPPFLHFTIQVFFYLNSIAMETNGDLKLTITDINCNRRSANAT